MKIIRNIAFLLLACLCSCNLDRYPFNAIEKEQSFKSFNDAVAFNNALYAQLRGRTYGIYAMSPDIQTDLFHACIDFGNRRGQMYTWSFIDNDYDIRDIWAGYYGALANINNFLDNIDKITGENAKENATLANFKGEAYFLRAYYYQKLVTRYAKDYEPATAAAELGVPIVLHYDFEQKPSRATVEQVYLQILDDLKEAKSLITTSGKAGSERITKDCVAALEARVYLDMHKYGEAVAAADGLINGNTYPLVKTIDKLHNIWKKDAPDETILMLYSAINELGNANNVFLVYKAATKKYSPDFIPEQKVIDLFDKSDFRSEVYFKKLPVTFTGVVDDDSLILLDKYPGNPTLYSGTVSNYQHKQKVFRIAEVHLIKAEALAWNGQDGEALNALNVLRTARGLNALSGISGNALKNEIKDEKLREMIGEGNRLDDLKRWKDGFERSVPQNDVVIYTTAVSLTKAASDPKFVWAIPAKDMTTNPNLKGQQNPGW